MHFFKRCGMQAFAFTTKHHDGFSMFHTKTRVKQRANYLAPKDKIIEPCDLAYSIEETPFKRDIVKELCDAARKHALKIDLYFSHPDWYDADFRPYNSHPLTTKKYHTHFREFGHPRAIRGGIMTAEPTAAERARMVARHREQLRELLTNYGKIDMVCLDQWLGKDVWPETKETIKLLRKWAPDTLLRARGIGNYGDYFQPEGFVPGAKENTNMPWMAIIKLAKPFSYDPDPKHYKGEKWVLSHMVDCVSKGGSFMVCIGPDEFGEFHPEAVRQLEKVGDWLRTNGEGIYETRARKAWKEGAFKFTQSKDKNRIYAFTEKWPQGKFTLKTFTVKKGSAVFLLGHAKPLRWQQTPNGAEVEIPAELNAPENRPSKHIWGFKFEVQQ
jgi:alpha-L-fucosidase